jgi:hypothetical protein
LTDINGIIDAANWSLVRSATAVPAPGALALFAIGLVGLGAVRRRYPL